PAHHRALEHHDLGAEALQLPGAGEADDPAADHRHPRESRHRWMVVAQRTADYDELVRATAMSALVLGPADTVAGKPFAHPSETRRDASLMAAMLDLERATAGSWPAGQSGPRCVSEYDEAGRRHFLAVPEVATLLGARDVPGVGLLAEARE